MFRRSFREETTQLDLVESTRTIYFRAITTYLSSSTLTVFVCLDLD